MSTSESLDLAAHLAEPMPIAVLGQLLGCVAFGG